MGMLVLFMPNAEMAEVRFLLLLPLPLLLLLITAGDPDKEHAGHHLDPSQQEEVIIHMAMVNVPWESKGVAVSAPLTDTTHSPPTLSFAMIPGHALLLQCPCWQQVGIANSLQALLPKGTPLSYTLQSGGPCCQHLPHPQRPFSLNTVSAAPL